LDSLDKDSSEESRQSRPPATDPLIRRDLTGIVADTLPEVVFQLTADGHFYYINSMGIEQLGHQENWGFGDIDFVDLFNDDDKPVVQTFLQRALEGEQLLSSVFTITKRNGSVFDGFTRFRACQLSNGKPGISGLIVDVTSQKRAEEWLSHSLGRFRELAEMLP
jgi:PAS domain S-box-containing protein